MRLTSKRLVKMGDPKPFDLNALFGHVDKNKDLFIQRLAEAVSIPSVSSSKEHRSQVIFMVKWMANLLRESGFSAELFELGDETFPDGSKAVLPPAILGHLGKDPKKKTLLIYGHLDVQPASKEDGWDTEPFKLVEKDGRLFGRGSSDDKGPVLGWLHAIQAYQALHIDLPVNIKCVFEGMEESGSKGLEELLIKKKDFLDDVDYVCISDNYWLGTSKPCVTYGLRGCCYFFIEVQCAAKDLHSGLYGGSVHEAMSDLVYLLNSLVSVNGRIAIPGIMDDVEPLCNNEQHVYSNIEFDIDDYRQMIGCKKLIHEDKVKTLMSRWRYPSLSIHGIEGAFHNPGCKTVIPRKVIGKFSIRIVPDQKPEHVAKQTVEYLDAQWKARNSPNTYKAYMVDGGNHWKAPLDNFNVKAAAKATKNVYNVEPDYTREGGSIPITLLFQELTGKSVILLPMGAGDDGAHSQNEKIDVRNYIEGTKVFCSYLHEIAQEGK